MSELQDLQDKKDAIVIDLFLNNQNNTVPNLAKLSGLQEITVHQIINKYLKNKTINARF
ncbi:hypothetical protein H9I45_15100 [Polaribacter haliotis]|uniref:Uncharacterized protein n=1 Tax=Polaribacter haliotis TaxID=1888915 RepID=A0A7L8AF55_9FLAO|nr:hypothetical protein [Polaribacter haliotis]QOD60646.1 hypothetical protein H9I45_15100 [Polaribacter haliotis]